MYKFVVTFTSTFSFVFLNLLSIAINENDRIINKKLNNLDNKLNEIDNKLNELNKVNLNKI